MKSVLRSSLLIGAASLCIVAALLISLVLFFVLGAFNFANFIAGGFIAVALFVAASLLLFPLRRHIGAALACGVTALLALAWACELAVTLWRTRL
jgi:hypothetical protein